MIRLIQAVIFLLVILLGFTGWGLNLYKLTQTDFRPPYKAEALRTIGVFIPPLGAIMGWIDIQDN